MSSVEKGLFVDQICGVVCLYNFAVTNVQILNSKVKSIYS